MKKQIVLAISGLISSAICIAAPTTSGSSFDFKKGHIFENVISKYGNNLHLTNRIVENAPQSKEAVHTPVITEVEGTEKLFSKHTFGSMLYWGDIYFYEETFPALTVWTDNNEVYFKDIITRFDFGTYIKGNFDGDKIEISLPQTIYWYDDDPTYGEYGLNLVMMKAEYYTDSGLEYITYVYDEEYSSVEITVNPDGSMTLDLPGEPFNGVDYPDYIMGVVDTDGNLWTGFSEFVEEYEPFNYELNKLPEGLQTSEYAFIEGSAGHLVEVGIDDETGRIYIKGLSEQLPEAVIYGDIQKYDPEWGELAGDGRLIAVPQYQFVGFYFNESFVITKCFYLNPDFDYEDENSREFIPAPDSFVFYMQIDPETGTITPLDMNLYLSLNVSFDHMSNVDLYKDFVIQKQENYSGTPANPFDLVYEDETVDIFGYYRFYFTIPTLSTAGSLLSVDDIYYKIFVDGMPFTFEQEVLYDLLGYEVIAYEGVVEPTEILPMTFGNNWDIYHQGFNDLEVDFYMEGITTLGVQTVYLYDGETVSDIVTLDIETGEITVTPFAPEAGIDAISDAFEVETVYYDLTGRKVAEPANGLFIKRSILSDGSAKVSKVMIR